MTDLEQPESRLEAQTSNAHRLWRFCSLHRMAGRRLSSSGSHFGIQTLSESTTSTCRAPRGGSREYPCMAVPCIVQFAQLRQLLERQRTLALEHPKARRIAGLPLDQRAFDQPVEPPRSSVVDIGSRAIAIASSSVKPPTNAPSCRNIVCSDALSSP